MKKLYLAMIIMLPIFLFAHAHMFVDASIEVVFNEKGVAGFKNRWIFDDMFSSSMIKEFDKNGDKKLNKKEIAVIKKEAFSYTSEQNYFTSIKINSKQFPVKKVTAFKAEIKNNRLIYTFFVPCTIPAGKKNKTAAIAVYDSTFYVSFEFKGKKSITLKNKKNYAVEISQHDNTSEKYYFGQMSPLEFIITFRKK